MRLLIYQTLTIGTQEALSYEVIGLSRTTLSSHIGSFSELHQVTVFHIIWPDVTMTSTEFLLRACTPSLQAARSSRAGSVERLLYLMYTESVELTATEWCGDGYSTDGFQRGLDHSMKLRSINESALAKMVGRNLHFQRLSVNTSWWGVEWEQ